MSTAETQVFFNNSHHSRMTYISYSYSAAKMLRKGNDHGLLRASQLAMFRAPRCGVCRIHPCGEMPEWSIGAVSKTVVRLRTQGSNPCLSANHPLVSEYAS